MYDKITKERFWSKVNQGTEDECWEWQAGKISAGYGSISVYNKKIYAHRLAWKIKNGKEIPEGLCILHSCDNPACCNPNHLFAGTIADNNRDMRNKGRQSKGSNHVHSKLTERDIRKIRELSYTNISRIDIAKKFNISHQTVSGIIKKDTWAHVDTEWKSPPHRKFGELHPDAKLKEDDVHQIRKFHHEGICNAEIARIYCVSHTTISAIIRGKTWKHVI